MVNKTLLLVSILLCGLTAGVLSACGDDDDDDSLGNSQVAALKALLLDENGQVYFDPMGEGAYQIGLLSKQDAIDLIKLYVGNGFTGQPRTYALDDNMGTVDVASGSDGVFYSVGFAVKGIPQFRLWMLSDGGNTFGITHTCSVCGYTWKSTLNRCPREGNKSYHP